MADESWGCWIPEEPKIVEIEDEDSELDEFEDFHLPEIETGANGLPLDPEKICWPPRPTVSALGDLYDKMKAFILDETQMEYIFPPMDGQSRKLVHSVAELFELKTRSFGRKSGRHVRVYKYEQAPMNIELKSAREVADKNSNVRMKETKIPMFIKEGRDSLEDSCISQDEQTGESLIKRLLIEGDGEHPVIGDQVYVHYEGYYLDGGVFDSSRLRETEFTFVIGSGQAIPAWDIAMLHMKSKETAEIIVPPAYAFGPLGCPPRIPAGATIKYEIELLRFSAPVTESVNTLETVENSLAIATSIRHEGNALVTSKSHRKATKCYNRALNIFDKHRENLSEQEEVQINEAKVMLHSNLALCYLRLRDLKRAKVSAESALEINPKHTKSLCRMGEAFVLESNAAEAQPFVLAAHKNEPNDRKVKELLKNIQKLQKEEKERQRRMFQGVFT